jgi:hypothetical protein
MIAQEKHEKRNADEDEHGDQTGDDSETEPMK